MTSRPVCAMAALAVCLSITACATRAPVPPVPTTIAHPEFLYPTVPAAMRKTFAAEHVDLGWRYLQIDDVRGADREFAAALKSNPAMYPAHVGHGYVALTRRDFTRALTSFEAALKAEQRYLPALIGRGQSLLALRREGEALEAFEGALAVDPSLVDIRGRADVLRFRRLQDMIEAARKDAASGRTAEARAAYGRAIAVSPESAFLYRELGMLERHAGDADRALDHLRRAADLDPLDEASLVQLGELLEERQDFPGAEAAYRKAVEIDPSSALTTRLAAVSKRARDARLPNEYKAALENAQLTRGELAAIIGVRFDELLHAAPTRQAVVTDVRGHWAASWIGLVVATGVMEPFENHTFQPRTRVRRGDLAAAVAQLLRLIASGDLALRARLTERQTIADMNRRHIQYDAAATAVASGVMPLLEGDRFQVGRQVSGSEAVEVLDRVRTMTLQSTSGGL